MSRGLSQATLRMRLKSILLGCLYFTGILWILAILRLRRRAVVLMYHRVLPEARQAQSFSARSIIVTPQTFERQMQFISRFLHPVGSDEFLRLIRSRQSIPSRTCLVTFDDGWHDNLEFALPILRRHGLPAVVFVAADYVDTGRCFWQEFACRRLFALRSHPDGARILEGLGCPGTELLGAIDARNAIRDYVTAMKQRTQAEIDALLTALEREQRCNEIGEDRFLSWDEVRRIAEDGLVAIGSHAMSHTPLTRLAAGEIKDELSGSLNAIRAGAGRDPSLLAYPDGDVDAKVVTQAREAGFAAAFTTTRGLVSAETDRYLLPRINIHEGATSSPAAFLSRIVGLI